MLLAFGEYISVEFLLLNIFCQLLGGYMSFGGFLSRGPTVRGPIVHFVRADSWAPDNWAPGPNCPGPNCPLFQGGQLGPGQSGPGAQLSGAQLSTFSKRTVGPQGRTALAQLSSSFETHSWVPDSCRAQLSGAQNF